MSTPVSLARPLSVYLDQKDFGRIADALCRGDNSSPDFLAYDQLKSRVDAGEARVYFSFVHVVEALRFGNVRSPVVVSYCKVVDTLTDGHCIRFPSYLQRAELELALAELFSFPTAYSRQAYPYGKYADAVTADGLLLDYGSIGLSIDSALREIDRLTQLPQLSTHQ